MSPRSTPRRPLRTLWPPPGTTRRRPAISPLALGSARLAVAVIPRITTSATTPAAWVITELGVRPEMSGSYPRVSRRLAVGPCGRNDAGCEGGFHRLAISHDGDVSPVPNRESTGTATALRVGLVVVGLHGDPPLQRIRCVILNGVIAHATHPFSPHNQQMHMFGVFGYRTHWWSDQDRHWCMISHTGIRSSNGSRSTDGPGPKMTVTRTTPSGECLELSLH